MSKPWLETEIKRRIGFTAQRDVRSMIVGLRKLIREEGLSGKDRLKAIELMAKVGGYLQHPNQEAVPPIEKIHSDDAVRVQNLIQKLEQ